MVLIYYSHGLHHLPGMQMGQIIFGRKLKTSYFCHIFVIGRQTFLNKKTRYLPDPGFETDVNEKLGKFMKK